MGDLNFGFVLISFVGIQSQPRCQKTLKNTNVITQKFERKKFTFKEMPLIEHS